MLTVLFLLSVKIVQRVLGAMLTRCLVSVVCLASGKRRPLTLRALKVADSEVTILGPWRFRPHILLPRRTLTSL